MIFQHQGWRYYISWEDGKTETFENISEVDALVASVQEEGATDAPTDGDTFEDTDYNPWEAGTYVYKESKNGWLFGNVVSYDMEKEEYEVLFEDGNTERYPRDSIELDDIVDNAENYVGYPIGQPVAKEFDDGWYSGTITNFEVSF